MPALDSAAASEVSALVAGAWPRAVAHWSDMLLLSAPALDPESDYIARIDLNTRQIQLGVREIDRLGLRDCIEALLAHEVGHHVRYPGTLATQARLILIERSLVPLENFSALNLFTDLLINERLSGALGDQLARVYRAAITKTESGRIARTFLFVLTVYEELWRLEPGSLLRHHEPKIRESHAGYRAEAHLMADQLFMLGPNVYTQFLYFLSVLSRYLVDDAEDALRAVGCQCAGEPSAGDWADALSMTGEEREAIERALARGWLTDADAARLRDEGALERRIRGLPGFSDTDASQVPTIMAAWYRQQAERYLLEPPPVRLLGEGLVPTTFEAWETSDPVQALDWRATLTALGPDLALAEPKKREIIADEAGLSLPYWEPRLEIYLDVSGSMPDPRFAQNAMTLAAVILALGTLRSGGAARALLYSHSSVAHWEWTRSLVELSQFLMHYIGGGTVFPFDELAESVRSERDRQPLRIVISDWDFDHNVGEDPRAEQVIAEAASSAPLILLLHRPGHAQGRRDYSRFGARSVHVEDFGDFPRMAVALSHALFDGEREADA